MRIGYALSLTFLMCLACKRYEAQQAAFDGFLSTEQIQSIEFVNDETDKTNTLTGEAAQRILESIHTRNRIAKSTRGKSKGLGAVYLISNERRVGLHYYPGEQVLSFQNYEFTVSNINEISEQFK